MTVRTAWHHPIEEVIDMVPTHRDILGMKSVCVVEFMTETYSDQTAYRADTCVDTR